MAINKRLKDLKEKLKETKTIKGKNKNRSNKIDKALQEDAEIHITQKKGNLEVKIRGTIMNLVFILSQGVEESPELRKTIELLTKYLEHQEKKN